MKIRLSMIALFTLAVMTLAAQEGKVRFGSVTTAKPAMLKAGPTAASHNLKSVPAGTKLSWIEAQKKGKYYRVVMPKGPAGWVHASALDATKNVQPPPAPTGAQPTAAAAKCQPDLGSCTDIGCSPDGSSHALMNQSKRTFATGAPVTLAFSDFSTLQDAADAVVEQGQEIADRSVIQNLTVGSNTMGEGTAVQVVAFLASQPATPGPHPNTGESVNCNLRGPADNDFHIPITEDANLTEFDGIVAEMIPQGQDPGTTRNPGWTLTKLKKLQTTQRMVKITGRLFYDNAHVVNGDAQNSVGGQPRRFSLWEIHPISQFAVCKKADNSCSIDSDSDWTLLEDFH
jgi:hypothetical protein